MTERQLIKLFKFLASLKIAIPLLVATVLVTVIASMFPQPDFFRTWWYLGLLGLNALSLLLVTILHAPRILQRKGRKALIGVVTTHLGILILIAGAIYGGLSGFRYQIRAIEGEMTIVPGLPFVILLDKLFIEDYPEEIVAAMGSQTILRAKQDSHLTLLKNGKQWISLVAKPGAPARLDGITILPSLTDTGWYFELNVTDPAGKETVIPVRPWAPPVIAAGEVHVLAHSLMDTGVPTVQILTPIDNRMTVLGIVGKEQPLEVNGYTISLGKVRRYTGVSIYSRPATPILIVGCLAMLFGLSWHFYHRHRDSSQ